MKIKATTHLEISHSRKGTFKCFATRDFDTESEELWPVALAEGELRGASRVWTAGESIPCRSNLVRSWKIIGAPPEEHGEPSEAHTEPVLTRESVLSSRFLYSVLEQHTDGSWWYHIGETYARGSVAIRQARSYTDRCTCVICHTSQIPQDTDRCTSDFMHFHFHGGFEFTMDQPTIVYRHNI